MVWTKIYLEGSKPGLSSRLDFRKILAGPTGFDPASRDTAVKVPRLFELTDASSIFPQVHFQ